MKKPEAFIVVSRYKENLEWLPALTDNYIIYNKGENLTGYSNCISAENIGGNQYDICKFIYDNYENLPKLIAFVQGDPFDHCLSDRFYKLIYNTQFTMLFGDRNYPDGVYQERNTSWYINGEFNNGKPACKFSSFDDYMQYMFSDYIYIDNLVFPPGSQFIVEKERCLHYSKNFWKKMMDIFPKNQGVNGGREAHIVERSMLLIFENRFNERQII